MKIFISDEVHKKITYYTQISPIEISGLGYVEEENGDFYVKDLYLVKQYNTAATTELDQDEVVNLIEKLFNEGKDPSKLRLWWHSHVNMGCFWSGTDEDCIDGLCLDKYLLSIVTTKNNDYKMRLDIREPVRLTFDDLTFELDINHELFEQCQKDVEEKTR